MNEQNNDNQIEQNILLTDLEPIDEVKGGDATWTGSITLCTNTTIGATTGRRESTLVYSGEPG